MHDDATAIAPMTRKDFLRASALGSLALAGTRSVLAAADKPVRVGLILPSYDSADRELKPGDLVTRDMVVERHGVAVGPGEIALVNFGWMQRFWRTDSRSTWFVKNAPGIREDAIVHFKDRGIRAIGCDTVACDMAVVDGVGQDTTGHTHHWLPNGILIMEMLTNLDKLSRRCLFVATPLKIKEGSGSPIRPLAFCED